MTTPTIYAEPVANGATAFYFDREGWEWAFTATTAKTIGDEIATQRGMRVIAAVERPGVVMLADGTCTYEGAPAAVVALNNQQIRSAA